MAKPATARWALKQNFEVIELGKICCRWPRLRHVILMRKDCRRLFLFIYATNRRAEGTLIVNKFSKSLRDDCITKVFTAVL